jgi:hypothetical protein
VAPPARTLGDQRSRITFGLGALGNGGAGRCAPGRSAGSARSSSWFSTPATPAIRLIRRTRRAISSLATMPLRKTLPRSLQTWTSRA